jgi:hypothetical protein
MYKDCCSRRVAAFRAPSVESAMRESALAKLLAFAFQPAFDGDHSVAEIVFWGDRLRAAAPDAVQRLLASDDTNVKYNSWFLFDWEVNGTGTVAELFLEEAASGLLPAERQYLDTLSRVHLRLYEVERVDRGRSVGLVDLWTGERRLVTDRSAPDPVVMWDVLGARVAPDGAGGHRFEGGLYRYPAEVKAQLLARFRQASRRHQRRDPGSDAAAFFRRHGALFHQLWLDLVAFPGPLELLTSDGDPMVFCRVVFDTARAQDVRRAIGGHPDVRPLAPHRFVLHAPAPDGSRELGRWEVDGTRVVFETTSQARATRGRAWLESLAGGLVQYRATAFETLDQAMDGLRRPADDGPGARPPARDARAVTALFDRHYRTWLDRPLSELGHRTPRAAARTRTWRPRLITLLKRLENGAAHAALAGRAPYDFRWIWSELGLERPDQRP